MSAVTLDGRVAIVTGAGNGLGRAHALELARRGALVIVNDLGGGVGGEGESPDPAAAVAGEITALGGSAVAVAASVATEEGAASIVQAAIDSFGRVDIVVNNAGILRDQAFHKLEVATWDLIMGVHLRGTMLVTRAAWPHMREQGYGRVVTTTSAAGLFGNFGQASYAAAKMGIVGLSRVLAIEGATKSIRVNVIAPAALTRMTETVMTAEVQAMVNPSPELVAPLVAYLASEACSISGKIISVGMGRAANVVVGTAPGYFNLDATADDLAEQIDAVLTIDGLIVPETLADEMGFIVQRTVSQ